jgi:hypothetical protein
LLVSGFWFLVSVSNDGSTQQLATSTQQQAPSNYHIFAHLWLNEFAYNSYYVK